MDAILQGIFNVLCYLDDIFITGLSEKEHLQNLEEVLKRLHVKELITWRDHVERWITRAATRSRSDSREQGLKPYITVVIVYSVCNLIDTVVLTV